MHLSCLRCKTIQSFSGEPPKCDVCGWVCDIQRQQPANTNRSRVRRELKQLLWVVVVMAVGIPILMYWGTSEEERLASKYNIPPKNVFIQPKPHGCDFGDAPLGDKHCHFEKVVDVERTCPDSGCAVKYVYVSWKKVDE